MSVHNFTKTCLLPRLYIILLRSAMRLLSRALARSRARFDTRLTKRVKLSSIKLSRETREGVINGCRECDTLFIVH